MAPITTLLFDCDNTLVLSESLAFEACADLANEILSARGIADRYTGPQLLAEFVGQNFRGMIGSLKAKYNYEMDDAELESYVSKEEDKVIAKLKAALKPCDGVDEELARLEKEGTYKMAVVSSSALRRVKAKQEFFTVGYVGSYEAHEQKKMEGVLLEAGAKILMKDWREFKGILEKIQNGGLEN
ncbi:hypothetical protein EYC84_002998 [Monilinia fructicola]|uniref:Uncharacterized protein n=1 Tax=Monilinia fructicola TaxID=38448 RepID=A0A5M9JWX2_MONFR|nr:hypothetical protein EYC84_002998 [Monilinia fructicola]